MAKFNYDSSANIAVILTAIGTLLTLFISGSLGMTALFFVGCLCGSVRMSRA